MINQVIYEKKLNYYNTNYDNSKINKYLNKLNIYGGAEEINLAPDQIAILSRLPVLNRGSFGIVKQQGNFVIKQFSSKQEYEDEKMMYISKLTIPGGKINLKEEKYSYIDPNGDVTKNKEIDLNENNIKKMPTDNYHIKGNLLEYLKLLFPNELNSCLVLYIHDKLETYMSIYGNFPNGIFLIGTCYLNIYDEYELFFNYSKIFKLLNFNDANLLLYYKYLGDNLSVSFETKPIIDLDQRVLLCFDLIRQVAELIKQGIYHNDLKNQNIVLLPAQNGNIFLTIIDYGLAVTHGEMITMNTSDRPILLLTTENAYSNDYFLLNTKKMSLVFLNYILRHMSHWIIGGICMNILCWNNIQFRIFNSIYSSKLNPAIKPEHKNQEILKLFGNDTLNNEYLARLLQEFPVEFVETNPTYALLRGIIIGLLELGAKYDLSVHYDKFKDLPEYQAYLEQRRISKIDDY